MARIQGLPGFNREPSWSGGFAMSLPQSKSGDAPVTYGEYLNWPEDGRWEIIDGVLYDMSPAPSTKHQRVSRDLFVQIHSFLSEKPECEAFFAPFDVRLPEKDEADEAIINVVQPDIVVICDLSKIDDKGCRGAPDWIIEVLSPFTASKDHIAKRLLYERMGVREYWLAHPLDEMITIFILGADGKFRPSVFTEGKGQIKISALPDLTVDLDAVFR
jgi:Uma2 family endonuclease